MWVVHVISMEFLRSLLRRRFARAQVATLRNVGWFLRLAKQWFDGQFEADSRSATLQTLNSLKQHCNQTPVLHIYISADGFT